MRRIVDRALAAHRAALETLSGPLGDRVGDAGRMVVDVLRGGHKILFCGNGGSAADAQHLAAEITGRYVRDRDPLPAIALTTDTSALTAIANDYGFDHVFERQVRALARGGDLLVAISTSGKSASVLRAVDAAKAIGCRTLALTGNDGGPLARACDLSLIVPVSETARIQEIHILIGHVICEHVDDAFAAP
jgi:D-sedoheptulose 7-phosphate isomerase